MFRTHTALLAFLVLATSSCSVPVPQPPKLTIALKGNVRTPPPPRVHVEAEVQTEASVSADAAAAHVEAEPPVYTEPVPLVGATVVEFFGIPLEGTQDVVFVLDRSGSMEELALGQIAQLATPPPAPAPEPAPIAPSPEMEPPLSDAVPAPEPMPVEEPIPVGVPVAEPIPVAEPMPVAEPVAQSPRKIDVAHAELVDALQRLAAGTRMNVLFFNERFEAVEATITPLGERNREDAIAFVWQTVPYGATALAPAMRTAYLMNAKRIVLLSDGLGNVGGDAASVMRDAREAMRGGIRIDTIGLGQDQDVWLLRSLAQESGGIYQQL